MKTKIFDLSRDLVPSQDNDGEGLKVDYTMNNTMCLLKKWNLLAKQMWGN